MKFVTLDLACDGAIAEIRLNRPDLLNRFDMPAHIEFVSALETVRARAGEARVLILSAAGRVFSAGGDLEEMLEANGSASVRDDMVKYAKAVFHGVNAMPIPIIAAVQGAAIGLGATIATLCDLVVAWRGAKFADTHVNVGLVAGDGGIISWSQSIGINRAKRHLLTGEPITGEQAQQWGLVSDLVESPDAALPRARELAAKLAAMSPHGVNGTKQTFARLTALLGREALDEGLRLEMEAMASKELLTAIQQLRQK